MKQRSIYLIYVIHKEEQAGGKYHCGVHMEEQAKTNVHEKRKKQEKMKEQVKIKKQDKMKE